MAAEWCDGFLRLMLNGQAVTAECQDADFSDAMEIMSFDFGSSEGFEDDDGFFAVQDTQQRSDVAGARMTEDLGDDEDVGMRYLFGDTSYEEDFARFEGKDLTEVDACQFKVVKQLDAASPILFEAYCSMQKPETRIVFESATLSLRKTTGTGQEVYLTFVFADVVVYGYVLDIGEDAATKETLNLSFGKIRMEYKQQDETGTLGTAIPLGWSFIDRVRLVELLV